MNRIFHRIGNASIIECRPEEETPAARRVFHRIGVGVMATTLALGLVVQASANPAAPGSLTNGTPTKRMCVYGTKIYNDGDVVVQNGIAHQCIGNIWIPV